MTIGEAEEHRGVEIRGVGQGDPCAQNGVEASSGYGAPASSTRKCGCARVTSQSGGMGKPLMALGIQAL